MTVFQLTAHTAELASSTSFTRGRYWRSDEILTTLDSFADMFGLGCRS
ncbi:hypothetical protein [Pseudarthrobacter sp. MDT1-22]